MKKILLGLMLVFSLVGVLDSVYLSYEHFSGSIPPCTIGALSDCGQVLRSSYAVVFGIPLAVIGIIQYFLLSYALIYVLLLNKNSLKYLILIQAKIGLLASIYFVYLQLFILHAICLYCMLSALTSLLIFLFAGVTFKRERKRIVIYTIGFLYKFLLKRILFLFNPESVHVLMVRFGEILGNNRISDKLVRLLLSDNHDSLKQNFFNIDFNSPIGLAAGFDYEARLTKALSPWGFGFQTVGTITNSPYSGNPRPMLGRLPKSKSLMVNKGFKNLGAFKTIEKLHGIKFNVPVGISIGRTNSESLTQSKSIQDIIASFKKFEKSKINNSYYELNISCPNLFGNVSFYPPKNLEQLLRAVDKLHLKKPVFVKMPIDKSNTETLSMLKVIAKHSPKGVVFGNLQKNRKHPSLDPLEVKRFPIGNFSGKPTFDRSNELISLTYKRYKERFLIIGCGGVFSGKDAYEKIVRGASLVQLITGMIFEGPQLISAINFELVDLLERNGFSNISEAVGSKNKRH